MSNTGACKPMLQSPGPTSASLSLPEGPENPLSQSLDIRPHEVVNDVKKAVTFYCAKGFEAFDDTLLTSLDLSGDEVNIAVQGSTKLFAKVLGSLEEHMSQFSAEAVEQSLHLPSDLTLPQVQVEDAGVFSQEAEMELDQQLVDLRRKIKETWARRRDLDLETNSLKQQLAAHGHTADLEAVTGGVAAGKENLAEDAAAIAAMAKQLQPLIKHAEAILAQRQENRAHQELRDATHLAEKEIFARRSATNGVPTEALQCLLDTILPE